MSDVHWAIFALRDIRKAMDKDRYDIACYHIEDAILAIIARDRQNDEVILRAPERLNSARNAN